MNPLRVNSFKVDTRTTEKLSIRIPLPVSAASELAFKLGVYSENLPDASQSCDFGLAVTKQE
jgi:hypothetical protein